MRSPSFPPFSQRTATAAMQALLPHDLARSLAEVGFLAVDQKDWSRAQQIFSVLMAFRPQSEFPYVGLTLIDLLQCHWEAAAQWAKLGLVQVPGGQALAELRDIAVQKGVRP